MLKTTAVLDKGDWQLENVVFQRNVLRVARVSACV
jgi:hypothetical protein